MQALVPYPFPQRSLQGDCRPPSHALIYVSLAVRSHGSALWPFWEPQGLGANFRRGTIYCTPITAALVRQELRVASSHIREVPLGSPVDVEGVRVTFLEANHCPGAAMVS